MVVKIVAHAHLHAVAFDDRVDDYVADDDESNIVATVAVAVTILMAGNIVVVVSVVTPAALHVPVVEQTSHAGILRSVPLYRFVNHPTLDEGVKELFVTPLHRS